MKLSAYAYDLPLASPFRIAYDVVTESGNALVTAETDGLVGFGEAGPTPTITGETTADTREALRALNGKVPEALPAAAYGIAGSLAIETALLDVAARKAGEPLCTHLTGAAPSAIDSSITIAILDGEPLHQRIKACVDAGYSIFKVKAGNGIDNDLARIEAVRDAIGSAELRLDPNQGWTREEARAILPKLQDLGVDVLEQPLGIADLKGHADLVGASDVPIMLDESVFSPEHAMQAIAAGAGDRINIKIQKSGSLRRALEIADIAAAADIPCMLGCMIESRVGILAGAHVVAAHDNIHWADLDGATFLRDDPVTGGPVMDRGVIRLDDAPGLGVDSVAHGDRLVAELVA